ncbi:MAG: hypothetical protein M3Q36_03940 [bacterium]|nr:hypothetical protein [bacterium]
MFKGVITMRALGSKLLGTALLTGAGVSLGMSSGNRLALQVLTISILITGLLVTSSFIATKIYTRGNK